MNYLKTFEKLKVGTQLIDNRIVMGSMHTGLEDDLSNINQLTEYFVERAKSGVGIIITGGYSPNRLGRLTPFAGTFNSQKIAIAHKTLTAQVHAAGPSKILLQLLHAGRYSYHPFSVSASRIKSPITPFTPFALPGWMVKSTINDFVKSSLLAQQAGYNGVEIMGSEGYFIHQFFSPRTNKRSDEWGGSLENRCRLGVEIIQQIREKVGPDFILAFRIPILDLLTDGSSWDDIAYYAKKIQAAGANLLNSGIGWHESRVPTIGSMVPHAAFSSVTKDLKMVVDIPVIASNRFNEPEQIEKALSESCADMISMARPFLADPAFVEKARNNKSLQINPCIACNQACLDHIFSQKRASCLVNPTACEEKKWTLTKTMDSKKIAVVGAGVAGLNAALVLLKKGHQVSIYEAGSEVGGQFQLAGLIPGKKDYLKSLLHWSSEIKRLGGIIHFNTKIQEAHELQNYDHVIISTGVKPRIPQIPGLDLSHVITYEKLLKANTFSGKNIVIIGAGGIAVDVATYLLHRSAKIDTSIPDFYKHWGIETKLAGGLKKISRIETDLNITLLQRSDRSLGKGLGKTTGWIHRLDLKKHGVKFINQIEYKKITSEFIEIQTRKGDIQRLPADLVIVCAGQESQKDLVSKLEETKKPYSLIGGAHHAGELDAKKAIKDAFEVSFKI